MPNSKKQNKPHAKNICGAKTRSGEPCKNAPMANGRCRMHGGKSTGPKDLSKNKNAEKHGLFSKYLPKETLDLVNNIETISPIDILWDNIKIQYAAIIRAQGIMYVEDIEDKTIEKVGYSKGKIVGEKWEVQQAWDKHEKFLNSQARAMTNLTNMIMKYEELCRSELVTEEQKMRIEKLKVEVDTLKGIADEIEDLSEVFGDIYA